MKPFLSTREIANWLHVTPRTIRLWAELGEIPALRVGRQWRFRDQDVLSWAKSRENTLGSNVSTLRGKLISLSRNETLASRAVDANGLRTQEAVSSNKRQS